MNLCLKFESFELGGIFEWLGSGRSCVVGLLENLFVGFGGELLTGLLVLCFHGRCNGS